MNRPKLDSVTRLDTVQYGGWENCLRLTDGQTEAVITTDVGPRVIRYGTVGGPNLFAEFDEQLGKRGGKRWRIYGGHRLWVAPEDKARTYVPDNDPVKWTWHRRTLTFVRPADNQTGIRRELRLNFLSNGSLKVRHRLINDGRKQATVAPWALSVMARGGTAYFPNEPFGSHPKCLLPARPLVVWPYTVMSDPRWTWASDHIRLRQDTRRSKPQKIGLRSSQGWLAYVLRQQVFIKLHGHQAKAEYPDFGCNVEAFTNERMLELETLGPLMKLRPGDSTDHHEVWVLRTLQNKATYARLAKLGHSLVSK